MSIVLVLVIGLAAGGIARLLMSADAPGAWRTCAVLGVTGAVAAYMLAHWVGWGSNTGASLALHSSAIGGLGLVAMYRMTRQNP